MFPLKHSTILQLKYSELYRVLEVGLIFHMLMFIQIFDIFIESISSLNFSQFRQTQIVAYVCQGSHSNLSFAQTHQTSFLVKFCAQSYPGKVTPGNLDNKNHCVQTRVAATDGTGRRQLCINVRNSLEWCCKQQPATAVKYTNTTIYCLKYISEYSQS